MTFLLNDFDNQRSNSEFNQGYLSKSIKNIKNGEI